MQAVGGAGESSWSTLPADLLLMVGDQEAGDCGGVRDWGSRRPNLIAMCHLFKVCRVCLVLVMTSEHSACG